VGIPYVGDAPGSSHAISISPTEDPIADRQIRADFRVAERALINDIPVWWIETGNPGRQRDDIHLFSRDRDDGTSEPYIECSSCHDPHTKSRMFLRHAEPPGFICVTCHIM
jgi:predicted CXXCH cytochrome family protein